MKTGRFKKAEIYLSRQERQYLQLEASSDEFLPKAKRAQAMLLSADGLSNKAIAKKLGVTRHTIGIWRNCYLSQGIIGIQHKSPSRKYKYETQKEDVEQTNSNHNFSLCGLRPHRLRSFNVSKLQKETISKDVGAFLNLPGKKDKNEQTSVNSTINLERIIKIGSLFITRKAAKALHFNQVHSTLHKCFRLTRELEALDAHDVPYVFNDATYSVHIYCRGQLNVHFWPTSGKWVDYSNPDQQARAKHGADALLLIKYYRQRMVLSPQSLRSKQQKSRQQKESEAKRKRVEEALHLLSKSGIAYSTKNNGYYISVEGPGEGRVQLWPGSGYWRVCGYSDRYSGTPQEFLAWYLRASR